jgi:hypothetical protein
MRRAAQAALYLPALAPRFSPSFGIFSDMCHLRLPKTPRPLSRERLAMTTLIPCGISDNFAAFFSSPSAGFSLS